MDSISIPSDGGANPMQTTGLNATNNLPSPVPKPAVPSKGFVILNECPRQISVAETGIIIVKSSRAFADAAAAIPSLYAPFSSSSSSDAPSAGELEYPKRASDLLLSESCVPSFCFGDRPAEASIWPLISWLPSSVAESRFRFRSIVYPTPRSNIDAGNMSFAGDGRSVNLIVLYATPTDL